MSKHNINPDYYTVSGRERPANASARAPKAKTDDAKARTRWQKRTAKAKGKS
jgi:hypothetical protein